MKKINDNIVDASTLTQTCDQKKTDEKKIFIRKYEGKHFLLIFFAC